MSPELLQSHWPLMLAAAVALAISFFLLARKARDSARLRLRRVRRKLGTERGRLRRAERAVARAEDRLRRLERRADSVRPRLVQEAREALEDATALARIAKDQVMIAENHVRRVIFEEFAPARQARLCQKYLPKALPDKRPFSF